MEVGIVTGELNWSEIELVAICREGEREREGKNVSVCEGGRGREREREKKREGEKREVP